MTCIQVEVSVLPLSKERQVSRSHWTQARPHFRTVVVASVGVKLLRDPFHELEVRRFVRRVIPGEFCCGGDTNPVAESRNGDEIVFVDDRHIGRLHVTLDRDGERIALHRIDRQLDSNLPGQNRAVTAKCEYICISRQNAFVRAYPGNLPARYFKRLDVGIVQNGSASRDNDFPQRPGKLG